MNLNFFTRLALVGGALLLATSELRAQFIFEKLWSVATGERDYITSSANERGIAINPKTGNVLLVSRSGGNRIAILNGATGEEIGFLDMTDISGGTFPISTIGVADDGVIYAANLVSPAADSRPFKIYRWADEAAVPTVAYEGNTSDGMRFGDSLDVRGAGASTQIAAGTANAVNGIRFTVFTTTDGLTFTAKNFSPANVAAAQLQKGIAFGAGDTVYGKINGSPARHVSFNLGTGASALVASPAINTLISPVVYDVTNKLLAGVNFSSHELVIYDIEDLATLTQIAAFPFPTPATANGNGVGAIDLANGRLVALDTQNGVLAYSVKKSDVPVAPSITSNPVNQSVLSGGRVSLSVGATGTKPLAVTWLLNGNPVPNATNFTLTLTGTTLAQAGNYTAAVSNSVGGVVSSPATLTVTPLVESGTLTPRWRLGIGSRPYLANDNNHRGVAYNPARNHVLLVSRTLGNTNIYVLDAATGVDLNQLNTTGADGLNIVTGGTFPLNMIGVADDGAVYAANLTTTGAGFTIYRWENDSPDTVPTIAYGPADPGITRCGDTLAIRGAGLQTQILIASRSTNSVAIFRTTDGQTFEPTVITTADATAGNFGLGVAFGAGDTFWGKAGGTSLRQVGFDLGSGVGTTLKNYASTNFPTGLGPIGVDPTNGWLAAIAVENPDNLRLHDLSVAEGLPPVIDQELFPSDNDNLNGTGALAFGPGVLIALDSNNGIVAFDAKKVSLVKAPTLSGVRVTDAGRVEFTITGEKGREYRIESSPNLTTWTELDRVTAPEAVFARDYVAGGSRLFFRVVVR